MSGSAGGNLPVRIQVEGLPQAEAAFNRVAASGQAAMAAVQRGVSTAAGGQGAGLLQTVLEQTNGQLARMATQAAGGGSALAGMVSRAAGLLPMFGPAGIMAGAAASVATLAMNLFQARDATEELKRAQDTMAAAARAVNDLMDTQAERAARVEQEQRRNAVATLGAARAAITQAQALRAAQMVDLEATEQQVRLAREVGGEDTAIPRNVQDRMNRLSRLRGEMADAAAEFQRIDEQMRAAATDPTGRQRDQEARGSAGRAAREPRPLLDTAGAVARSMDEITGRLDAYSTAQNLANAGIERGAGALAEYAREQETLRAAVDAGLISEEQFGAEVERTTLRLGEQLDQIRQRGADTQDVTRQLGMTFSSMFEDAIVRGKRFSDVLKGVAADLARIIVRQSITTPLAGAANSLLKELDLSSIGTSIAGAFGFGGARAAGGPVSGGMAYLVGERGPELFVPDRSGGIVPNGAMGGGMTVMQTLNIDARGATPDAVARLEARIPAIARAAVEDAARRGGGFARSLRSA
jgi:hypothetical protein